MRELLELIPIAMLLLFWTSGVTLPGLVIRRLTRRWRAWGRAPVATPEIDTAAYRAVAPVTVGAPNPPPREVTTAAWMCFALAHVSALIPLGFGLLLLTLRDLDHERWEFLAVVVIASMGTWLGVERITTGLTLVRRSPHARRRARRMDLAARFNHLSLALVGVGVAFAEPRAGLIAFVCACLPFAVGRVVARSVERAVLAVEGVAPKVRVDAPVPVAATGEAVEAVLASTALRERANDD